jgi:ribosomal protein S27AE
MNDNHNKKCERCGEGTYKIADLNDEIHGELHCNKCGHLFKRLTNESATKVTETTKDQSITKSLQLLRDGFKRDFANYVYEDERITTLLMELSMEFVDANVPITDDELQIELAQMFIEIISIEAR